MRVGLSSSFAKSAGCCWLFSWAQLVVLLPRFRAVNLQPGCLPVSDHSHRAVVSPSQKWCRLYFYFWQILAGFSPRISTAYSRGGCGGAGSPASPSGMFDTGHPVIWMLHGEDWKRSPA